MDDGGRFPEDAGRVDGVLDTLSNAVRREIIDYFENDAPSHTMSLGDLVSAIERRMPSKTGEGLSATLYQDYLPTLESREWLEFDTQDATVTDHGHGEAAAVLEAVRAIFTS